MNPCHHTVAELLPHAPPMILLDQVVGWERGHVKASLTVRPGIPFFEAEHGVPVHVGLEYMAQTCGLYAGIEALALHRPVRLGFLLGTRNFQGKCDWFAPGQTLIIDVVELLRQDQMGVFDCAISLNEEKLATAQLNLYQPAALPGTGPQL